MKIAVLVPSAAYVENAGVRIRYGRVIRPLSEHGISLEIVEISRFKPDPATYDVIIISKCHDAHAVLVAQSFASRGGKVGVDLFDDYFSQRADSRMLRFRRWLAELAPWLDFVLCSTAAMASIAERYCEELPIIQLNDPAPFNYDPALTVRLERKLAEARANRLLQLCWFGIGDNPHFPVGISDVVAFSDRLAEIARLSDFAVELKILTNARALDARRLALLASLPISASISEWSEEAEADLLNRSFACFLPVNAQPFSIAKSQNRVVTALASGCQVISDGFPLYEPFAELIYRDVESFVKDAETGVMKLSESRSDLFWHTISQWASAEREAGRLANELNALDERDRPPTGPVALIHGTSTSNAAHELIQQLGGLSVATPFTKALFDYDVIFRAGEGTGLSMFVAPSLYSRLTEPARRRLNSEAMIGGKYFAGLPAEGESRSSVATDSAGLNLPSQLARYDNAIRQIRARLHEAFGTSKFVLSENSQLPFGASLDPFAS